MKNRRFRFLFLLLAFATCLTLRLRAYPQASSEQGGRAEQNAPADESPQPAEASGEDTEQFKHSGSVRLLSRITGLSLEGAYWLAVLINFAIVAGVIVWASRKNLPAMFRNRSASIQKSIEEARRASEDANHRLAQIEARLSRLDDDIAHMRVSSEKEAAAEEQRIQQAAEEDAKRIVESAEQEISAAAKAARRELTIYAADLAVNLAAKQIRVDAPTDQALVRQFASQLANAGNGKKA
jgi:F-type H+-transporting ATPase subunit b